MIVRTHHLFVYFAAALISLMATEGAAQDYQDRLEAQRGAPVDTIIDFSEFGNVDLRSGNLSLSIPLGFSYPVSDSLSFSLSLSYNSNVFDYDDIMESCSQGPGPSSRIFSAVVADQFNAGLGWEVNLGRFIETGEMPAHELGLAYIGPEGRRVRVFDDPMAQLPQAPDHWYSNDGSYIRVKRVAEAQCRTVGNDRSDECLVVERGEGTVEEYHRFGPFPSTKPNVAPRHIWLPTRFRTVHEENGQYPNAINIDYDLGASTWTIRDTASSSRVHTLQFAKTELFGITHHFGRLVSVQLAGGQVQGNPPNGLRYEFEYGQPGSNQPFTLPITAFYQGCTHPGIVDPQVFFLEGLTLPNGDKYAFTYNRTLPSKKLGALAQATVPTGAIYQFDYGEFFLNSVNPASLKLAPGIEMGVTGKRRYLSQSDLASGVEPARWSYESTRSIAISPADQTLPVNDQPRCFRVTTVTGPYFSTTDRRRRITESYFSNAQSNVQRSEGLPFTYCHPDQDQQPANAAWNPELDPNALFLSSRELITDNSGDRELLRSNFIRYAADVALSQPANLGRSYNARVVRQRTVYHDDPDNSGNPRWVESRSSDYDGLGHYRINDVFVSRNWYGNDAGQVHYSTIETGYNFNRGSLPDNGAGGGNFDPPQPDDPWILNTYNRQDTIRHSTPNGPAAESSSTYCFDSNTGDLRGIRSLVSGSTEQPNDALQLFTRDAGNITDHWMLGGDRNRLPAGHHGACDAPSNHAAEYHIRIQRQSGVPNKADFLDCRFNSGEVLLSIFDADIDAGTGLVSRMRDASGIATVFSYDALGRLISSKPTAAAETHTRYDYSVPGAPVARSVTCPNGTNLPASHNATSCGGAEILDQTSNTFDGIGRLVRERRLMPGNRIAERATEYNELGWTLSQSVWAPENQSVLTRTARTVLRDYDAFGRVGRTVQPDGSEIISTYIGNRFVETKTFYDGQNNQGQPQRKEAIHQQLFDHAGNVLAVGENSDELDPDLEWTSYAYNERNQLSQLCVNETSGVGEYPNIIPETCANGQQRLFNYNGRGLLVSSSEPEIDGFVQFSHDSRGNILQTEFANDPFFNTYLTYDSASRITQVRGDSNRLLKEFFYARTNSGENRQQGKLVMARRYNDLEISPGMLESTLVTETFEYHDPAGWMTDYSVKASDGPTFQSEIRYYDQLGNPQRGYDDLGNITAIQYPHCSRPPCAGSVTPRDIGFEYQVGLMSSVPGYIDQMSYHLNGQLAVIDRAFSNVRDLRELDADNWRLNHICTVTGSTSSCSGVNPIWNFGPITYDDSGNVASVQRIGNSADQYIYDEVGRLRKGTVQSRSLNAGATTLVSSAKQMLSYDEYGNILSLANDAGAVTPGPGAIIVDENTNRIRHLAGQSSDTFRYDAAGNLTTAQLGQSRTNYSYSYDPFNRMRSLREEGIATRGYLYTASDERIATLDLIRQTTSWTPRSADNRVLRRIKQDVGDNYTIAKDYIHAGPLQVAAIVPVDGGWEDRHFHHDHLGTTRTITDSNGNIVEVFDLLPFGGYTQAPSGDDEELLFTGHERDRLGTDPAGDLDYMHARFYLPHIARFTSVDPVSGAQLTPQSWNRYGYANNSPKTLVDPDGRDEVPYETHGCLVNVCGEGMVLTKDIVEVSSSVFEPDGTQVNTSFIDIKGVHADGVQDGMLVFKDEVSVTVATADGSGRALETENGPTQMLAGHFAGGAVAALNGGRVAVSATLTRALRAGKKGGDAKTVMLSTKGASGSVKKRGGISAVGDAQTGGRFSTFVTRDQARILHGARSAQDKVTDYAANKVLEKLGEQEEEQKE